MKRKFLKNLFLLIFLNLLIKPFWVFGIDLSIQNSVGTEEYGFYFSLLSFSLLFNILLDLGITNFNNRNIARNPSLIAQYFSNIVIVKFFLAFVYAIVSLLIAILLGYEQRHFTLLLVIIFNQFLSSFLLFLRSNISGLQFYTTDSLLSIIDRCIMILLCSLVIWGGFIHKPLQIEWFVYIQTISYTLAIIVVATVLVIKCKRLPISYHHATTLQIIKEVAPFAFLGLLMAMYSRMDSVLIERLLPDGKIQAGIYAQSFRILDAFSNFSLLFASLLLPMFSRLIGSKENFVPLLKISFSLILILSISLALGCFYFSFPIINTLYHHEQNYSASVFSFLVLSFIPISVSYIFGTLLTAKGHLKALNYISLGAVCINLLLNIILIPAYKAKGAAISSFVTQTIVALIQIVICIKIWHFKIKPTLIARYIVFIMLAIVGGAFISTLSGSWVIRFLFLVLLISTSGLFIGILPVKKNIKAIWLQISGMKI